MEFKKCIHCQREYFATDDKCPFCGKRNDEEVIKEDNVFNDEINDNPSTNDNCSCYETNGTEVIVHRKEYEELYPTSKSGDSYNANSVNNPIVTLSVLIFALVFIVTFISISLTNFISELSESFSLFDLTFFIIPSFMLIVFIVLIIKTIKDIIFAKKNNIPLNELYPNKTSSIKEENNKKHECVYYDSFSSRFVLYSMKDEKYNVKAKNIKKINFSSLTKLLTVNFIYNDKNKKVVLGFVDKKEYLKFKNIVTNKKEKNLLDY